MKEIPLHDFQRLMVRACDDKIEIANYQRRAFSEWGVIASILFPSTILPEIIKALIDLLPIEDDESHNESIGDEVKARAKKEERNDD
jgi:hypothetical protein